MESPTAELAPASTAQAARPFGDGVVAVLRDVTRTALAGIVTGILVLGVGGRVVMRLAAVIDPGSVGRFTENGNVIGTISADGSLAVILFGGLIGGVFGSIVWIAVSPWLPGHGLRRAVLAIPLTIALSGFLLVDSGNVDFRILDGDALVIALLLGLLGAFGFALALVDERLDRALPSVARTSSIRSVVYVTLVMFGAVSFLPGVVASYFGGEMGFAHRPSVLVGLAIGAAGLATVAWWIARANGRNRPPNALTFAGGAAVLAAFAFGTARVVEEVSRILGGR